MTDPLIYGWCPGALRPMQSGDGLVVRLRLPRGHLQPAQARLIAKLALQCGNGQIDLTARANLQLRGVSATTYQPLIAALQAEGLIDATPEAESNRNIITTPFWTQGDDTIWIAEALAQVLTSPHAPQLPGKFGFAVDCGPAPMLGDTSADIRIERAANGLICRADAQPAGRSVTRETAAATAMELAQWFVTSGTQPNHGRMAKHIASGASLPAIWLQTAVLEPAPQPIPGPCAQGLLVALEFGRMNAQILNMLADTGPLRLTPWRMVLVEGASKLVPTDELILNPQDPRLRIAACSGAPTCLQGLGETRQLARALAPHLAPGKRLHLSGCAKGCASHGAVDATLIATTADRFDLIYADDRRQNLDVATLLSHPEILNA